MNDTKFKISLQPETVEMIAREMESISEKYHKQFNSTHEGYAVLLEEVRELEQEVFFGEKKHKQILVWSMDANPVEVGKQQVSNEDAAKAHKNAIREECIQIAAMACRIVQELT
jgi:predicted RNA-binding protein with PUA domain